MAFIAGNYKVWSVTIVLSFLCMAGCALTDPNRRSFVPARPADQVHLVFDSPVVERLITDVEAKQRDSDRFCQSQPSRKEIVECFADMRIHPERYPLGRNEFLAAMSQSAGITVSGKQYCRIVKRSSFVCGPPPANYRVSLVKIRITSGPSRGQEGWACESQVFWWEFLPE